MTRTDTSLLRRLPTAALLALTLLLAAPAAGLAADDDEGGGSARPQDNSAVAINEQDGSSLFELAFEIRRVAGDVVDSTNEAVAQSTCTNCRTVAIAIQILLVEGSPSTVTPSNQAVAVNFACTTCQTVAFAYQYVFGTGGPVEFTKEGLRRIAKIRREFAKLDKEGLTTEEIEARAAELSAELKEVVRTQLVPRRDDDDDDDEDDGDDDDGRSDDDDASRDAGAPTPAPGATGGAEPQPGTATSPQSPAPQEPAPAPEQPPAETTPAQPAEPTQPPADDRPAGTTEQPPAGAGGTTTTP